MKHDLIKTGDADSFAAIQDRNGEVALAYCRRCRKGEGELGPHCIPTYPHTLTSEQFAIISVALDNAHEREAAYVARHDDRPIDHLDALNELRRLWAFAGPVVINPRPGVAS